MNSPITWFIVNAPKLLLLYWFPVEKNLSWLLSCARVPFPKPHTAHWFSQLLSTELMVWRVYQYLSGIFLWWPTHYSPSASVITSFLYVTWVGSSCNGSKFYLEVSSLLLLQRKLWCFDKFWKEDDKLTKDLSNSIELGCMVVTTFSLGRT